MSPNALFDRPTTLTFIGSFSQLCYLLKASANWINEIFQRCQGERIEQPLLVKLNFEKMLEIMNIGLIVFSTVSV